MGEHKAFQRADRVEGETSRLRGIFFKRWQENRVVGRPCDTRSTKNPGLGLGCPGAAAHTLRDLAYLQVRHTYPSNVNGIIQQIGTEFLL